MKNNQNLFEGLIYSRIYHISVSTVPDGVVSNITTTEITYNSISLYWEMIPYLNQNGPNIRYIITLQEQGSSDPPRIITRATNTAFIVDLLTLTTYEIFITASNSEGNALIMSQIVQFTTLARRECVVQQAHPCLVQYTLVIALWPGTLTCIQSSLLKSIKFTYVYSSNYWINQMVDMCLFQKICA